MREYLKKSGIDAQEVGNSRISFSVNNLNYYFEANDSDPYFLRLALPRINRQGLQIDDNIEQQISRLNRNYKVAKIIRVPDDALWIVADVFVYSIENVDSLFARLIQVLREMIGDYRTIEINAGSVTTQTQQESHGTTE